jgi:hypothetical protein
MRALNAKIELSDTARVLTWGGSEAEAPGFDLGRPAEIRRSERKHENSGNEAKKWLKTKDVTFLNAANYARFACRFARI